MGIFLVILALVGAGYVWVRVAQARQEDAAQKQKQENCRRLVALDPRNSGAHEALGDALRVTGRLTEARESYQNALDACGEAMPVSTLQYKLRQVELSLREREVSRPPAGNETILCPHCGDVNPPFARICETCHAPMPYQTFREAIGDKELRRAAAESAACLLVLALVFRLYSAMPLDIKGCLIMSATIVVGWRFLQALGPKRM